MTSKRLPTVRAFIKKQQAKFDKAREKCEPMGFKVGENMRPYYQFWMELIEAGRKEDADELQRVIKAKTDERVKRSVAYEMCKYRLCDHNHEEDV